MSYATFFGGSKKTLTLHVFYDCELLKRSLRFGIDRHAKRIGHAPPHTPRAVRGRLLALLRLLLLRVDDGRRDRLGVERRRRHDADAEAGRVRLADEVAVVVDGDAGALRGGDRQRVAPVEERVALAQLLLAVRLDLPEDVDGAVTDTSSRGSGHGRIIAWQWSRTRHRAAMVMDAS